MSRCDVRENPEDETMKPKFFLLMGALWSSIQIATAQTQVPPPDGPARRVSLSAQAQVQVEQDVLTLTLQVVRQAIEAQTVQTQLKSALDAALTPLRADAVAGRMDVRSGRYALVPRYDRDGRISGWQGTAELVLEGTDTVRITQAVGKVQGMTVARLAFGLTPAQRLQAQTQAQNQAVSLFRQRAAELARGFAAAGYVVDDIQVHYDDAAPMPRAELMAARAMGDTSPLPVQAGQTTLTVSVTGSVRLE